jgi:methenyltetrahydromethanopterin cyclohydrolase
MKIPEYILIIAGSGRMLAQAVKNAGLKPLVIDLFADLDTQRYAIAFRQIPSLTEKHLAPAVDYFINRYAVSHVIYGSGFEYYPESLYYLSSRLIMLGNSPDTFVKLHNKPEFFSVLDALNITYPNVSFKAPNDIGYWLLKPMQGQGGVGIKRYHNNNDTEPSAYWQEYQAGTQHSALFLADGQLMRVLGFNTQWTVALSEAEEFIFSGVVNSSELLNEHKALVTDWLTKLVPVFGLKGLNSLDFIQAGAHSYLLEINPRPSASMQLYNDASLLIEHIKASQGELSDYNFVQDGNSAYQIVYANQDMLIPEAFAWPDFCMDLPKPGSLIHTGQPVCSIIIHQNEAKPVSYLQHLAATLSQSLLENLLQKM